MTTAVLTKQEISINRDTLSEVLSNALQAISVKVSRPILADVLFKCVDGVLEVSSYNEQIGIKQRIDVEGNLDAVCIPARLFADTISKQPKGADLTLEYDGHSIIIKRGKSKSKVAVHPADEYPLIEIAEGQASTISTDDFIKAMPKVLFSTSTEETKQTLTGVNLNGTKAGSTDGHRLSVATLEDAFPGDSITVPSSTLSLILKLAGSSITPEIGVNLDERMVSFQIGNTELHSRLIEGQYPNYPQLIPQSFIHAFTLNRAELIQRLDIVMVMAAQKNDVVTLTFSPDSLVVSAEAGENGDSQEWLECSAADFEVSLNGKYFLEALKNLGSEDLRMHCNSATTPIVIKPIESGVEGDYIHLLMPIQKRS
ncbi:MAG: DNA polymerase III subunit beta [Nodosilinea sp. WJT8-NPBG4]|jgi:DNA polymerase-3 subunit beta|nr:DNA polymerase III subunit beta [Nodosilinea sp. WJT8-NPBG4]